MKKQILSIASIALFCGAMILSGCSKDDTTAPVITLTGDATITHTLNTTYTDLGATATDDNDGDLTSSITVSGTVNKDLKGTYELTYTVSDAAGNTATKKRTVNVVNSAENFAGNYAVTDVVGGTTYPYNDVISTSSTVNNRIWVTKFANYINGSVYFDISGSTVTLPMQTVTCGNPAASRAFSGNGSVSGTTIGLNYIESTNGTSVNGVEAYTKQ